MSDDPPPTAADRSTETGEPAIAVVIPCYNEASTIEKVVRDFQRELPSATVVVVDNNSTDETAAAARRAGATVLRERKQGKGFAIRTVFQRLDADYYVVVDGDGTYEPRTVRDLLEPLLRGECDMAVGRRVSADPKAAYRPLHRFGNRLVRRLIGALFGARLTDIMSGYRAFNREVVRCTPLVSRGFEIETELTVQALAQEFVIVEHDTPYYARPAGSVSKLSTLRDGARVLWTIFGLFMAFKPLTFFGSVGIALLIGAVAFGAIPIHERFFSPEHQLRSLAKAMVAGFLSVLAMGCFLLGVVLTHINNRYMAMASLLTRGRLAERHSRRVWVDAERRRREKGTSPP